MKTGALRVLCRGLALAQPGPAPDGSYEATKPVRPSVRPQQVLSISMKFGVYVEVDD